MVDVLEGVARAVRPRWDGNALLFDLLDGEQEIACAISGAAIEQINHRRCFKQADALAFFDQQRTMIEALTLSKLRARSGSVCGRLTIWADDADPEQEG